MDILILLTLIALGFLFGTYLERVHYQSILLREEKSLGLTLSGMKQAPFNDDQIEKAELVQGNVVIATDFFKRIAAALRGVFGGNIRVYESLIDRARREAVLRLKESAKGADMVICLRVETATVGTGRNKHACVEAFAYGTALTLKK